ncbi:MAG: hypothetical protein WCT01_03595 [Candidatus Shapirobacteria bacterium]
MNNRIALFFGGKVSQHLGMIKKAARLEGVELDLISYNRVCFETNGLDTVAVIRGTPGNEDKKTSVNDYRVLFFRTTGKHWEEVDLIINSIDKENGPVVVDPIVKAGKPDMACKAWQMMALSRAGLPVPKTVYGSLGYLVTVMGGVTAPFTFPVILKGSGGDRGTRVFKADNLEELEKLASEWRRLEIEDGKRFMLQEFIENRGDYRVLVLGEKVLGVMKRTSGGADFRNNFSMGGKVEVADLPQDIKKMAVEATRASGLMVAGVDVMPRQQLRSLGGQAQLSENREDYVILEVNKGPQFKGFMAATGIDVPREIVRFLKSLSS